MLRNRTLWVIALFAGVALVASAQNRATRPVQRARLPKFDTRITGSIFFDDIFAESGPLKGPRPTSLATAPQPSPGPRGAAGSASNPATSEPAGNGGSGSGWSKIISAESVEAEVKSIASQLQEIKRPSEFAAGANVKCRTHFSILSLLFAIAGEYDGEIKWKSGAPALRDAMAQTAGNCKTNTEQVFKEVVRQRDETLQKLLSGDSPTDEKEVERATDWSQIADRVPLMQRLDSAKDNLGPWTSNRTEFQKNQEAIVAEAELAAAIAAVLMKEGMDDAGDEAYDEQARRLLKGASELVSAVKIKNDDQARAALGEINKACSDCHDTYR